MTTDRPTTNPLRGVATISLWADDVAAARDWYAHLLGTNPYFVHPEAPEPDQ